MHVHGNHLSPPLPIETTPTANKIAAQRAENVRKKLLESAGQIEEEDAEGEDRLMVRRWTDEDEAPPEPEEKARSAARRDRRLSEEEAVEGEENGLGTSMWA